MNVAKWKKQIGLGVDKLSWMKKKAEYIIYADESDSKGEYFSHFYGGLILPNSFEAKANEVLEQVKARNNLHGELKWQKITANYLDKYKDFTSAFLDLIESGNVRICIMFTDNRIEPEGLTSEHRRSSFMILYYQFARHAFGLRSANPGHKFDQVNVRFRFDELPDRTAAHAAFTGYIRGLPTVPEWKKAKLHIPDDGFAEVDSKAHLLMQGLDIVLGAACFWINRKYEENPAGKRTRAKVEIANLIFDRIRQLIPGFDPFQSTQRPVKGYWRAPYRHWCFVPKKHKAR